LKAAILAVALLLAACAGATGPAATPSASPSPAPPTPTPEPLAASVNGTPITLADLRAEIARFEAAQKGLGMDLATQGDYSAQILQALIDRRLLANDARDQGASLDPSAVEVKVEELSKALGGNEAMGAWLAANGYTLDALKASLGEEMLAEQTVRRLSDAVPITAEQVHARHILVASQDQAEAIRARVLAGEDFATLAQTYSLDLSTRLAGGDLGWFAHGALTTPEVEDAAFALQPGEVGPVVQSRLGFHVVELIERAQRPLSPDALQHLRQKAVEDWLAEQRKSARIEILNAP
jgi:peptidyl-prolyl cis-trans isomerase C